MVIVVVIVIVIGDFRGRCWGTARNRQVAALTLTVVVLTQSGQSNLISSSPSPPGLLKTSTVPCTTTLRGAVPASYLLISSCFGDAAQLATHTQPNQTITPSPSPSYPRPAGIGAHYLRPILAKSQRKATPCGSRLAPVQRHYYVDEDEQGRTNKKSIHHHKPITNCEPNRTGKRTEKWNND